MRALSYLIIAVVPALIIIGLFWLTSAIHFSFIVEIIIWVVGWVAATIAATFLFLLLVGNRHQK
ncbi:hypothetical protein [Levilactobacillus bambusae]|uniref:Uncharacterized protein n=1 Tax=Levilactobacillus bambusae TaxID=2024736 RepID=A0A2V1N5N6_9LACO|nr:hypothetical protein [Levilactobacillus bambusae]PWG01076.1 hypothetical protein DCM90_02570 [Levilactobacillus bambusae]